jgi:hypothetical protein
MQKSKSGSSDPFASIEGDLQRRAQQLSFNLTLPFLL